MSETQQSRDRRRLRQLVGVGIISCGLIGAIALLSRQFAITVPSAQRPHLAMWGLFTLLFAAYLAAVRIATRISNTRQALSVSCLFAAAFRLIFLFTTPIQEIDLYRYVWDGNVVAGGVDPYRFSPQNVIHAGAWAALGDASVTGVTARMDDPLPSDPLQRLVEIERRSIALGRILRTIHYAELPTPYPPVSQAVFALAALTTPDKAAVQTHLLVMKAWIVLFDLLTLAAMIALLRAVRLPVGWCVAYAWCPLVLKEFANGGHLDAIAVCLTTASLWLLIDASRLGRRWRIIASAGLMGLGIGAKLFPVVLLPVILAWLARQQRWRTAGLFAIVVIGVGTTGLWPMLGVDRATEVVLAPPAESAPSPPLPTDLDAGESAPASLLPRPVEETRSAEAASRTSGLGAFLTRWKMNDFLFLIVNENLDPSVPKSRQPWFAVVPDEMRMTIVSPIMETRRVDAAAAAFLLARALTLGVFGLLTMWWAWRLWQPRERTRPHEETGAAEACLLEAAFLTLAWFWFLSPTQNPWYWTWCLPLLPFARSRVWIWVSGVVMVYYLRFWLNAHWPEPPGPLGSRHNGASFFDFVLVWFEFGPLLGGLLVGGLLRRRGGQQ